MARGCTSYRLLKKMGLLRCSQGSIKRLARHWNIGLEETLGSTSLGSMRSHHLMLVLEHKLRLRLVREGRDLRERLNSRNYIREMLRLSLQKPIHILLYQHLLVHLLAWNVHLNLLRLAKRCIQQIATRGCLAEWSLMSG